MQILALFLESSHLTQLEGFTRDKFVGDYEEGQQGRHNFLDLIQNLTF